MKLREEFSFVLIGGWSVWLYTKQLKSKDIDLVISFDDLLKLRTTYPLTKNERLKKYEARKEEIQIDIYVPYYSDLGVPLELILKTPIVLEGFQVPPPETLLILKQTAYRARTGSAKGQKDLLDMIGLLTLPQFSWKAYHTLASPTYLRELRLLLQTQTEVPELGLNRHQFSRRKKFWLGHISPSPTE